VKQRDRAPPVQIQRGIIGSFFVRVFGWRSGSFRLRFRLRKDGSGKEGEGEGKNKNWKGARD
jgi:hypothetical protein